MAMNTALKGRPEKNFRRYEPEVLHLRRYTSSVRPDDVRLIAGG
jgi:hypothetical protein